jgi:L-galactose dehydrogenase
MSPRRTPLGRTGISLPALGFGCSPLGGVFGDVDEATAVEAVHAALAAGLDYFDTAPFYGLGRSEAVLGRALAGVPRERYVLGSKVGRWGETDFDFSPEAVEAGLRASLARLGVAHLDLVVVHDVEHGDLAAIAADTLPWLRRARDSGLVRAIGASGLPLAALKALASEAELDFVLTYAHRTLADTTLDEALPWFAARGLGVINAAPLGMGLFTRQGPPAWHPAPDEVKAACARAVAHALARGVDPAGAALRFALAARGVASTLVGMATPAEVAANLAWAADARDAALEAELQAIVAPVAGLSWPSGRWPAPALVKEGRP